MTEEYIRSQAEALKDYVVSCRRTIHRFAEVDGTEIKTGNFIKSQLEEENIPWEMVSKTGFVALLDTGRPGPAIGLRADMDALPMKENPCNLKGKRVVVSDDPETCHACGHDAHCAMLLGAMKALSAARDELTGKIYFIFEQGEEACCGGVDGVVDFLKRTHLDVVWGIHVFADLESGKISVEAGPRMTANFMLDITVRGKGGHASRPDMARNPVFCAASMITALSSAWVNRIKAGETVTLAPTSIIGGSSWNIIPDEAQIIGTCRFFSHEEGMKALNMAVKCCENIAELHECTVEFGDRMLHSKSMPVVNDPHYSKIAAEYIEKAVPGLVAECPRWYASETFGRYQALVPGVFAFLGIKNEEKGTGAPHHNQYFDVDEDMMPYGMMSTLSFVRGVQETWQ